jgi:hypothetical protein
VIYIYRSWPTHVRAWYFFAVPAQVDRWSESELWLWTRENAFRRSGLTSHGMSQTARGP